MSGTSTSKTNGADAAAPQQRSRLAFDLDVDICVVGAGLAGLTLAREAARLGASVAVLEGRHIGWNASGHQLGTVMPGYSLSVDDLIARSGLEHARELWALSKEGAEYVRATATEELWFVNWEFKGFPWQSRLNYERWSPNRFAANFNTPTLSVIQNPYPRTR